MLHPCISPLEGPLLAPSAQSGWGTCHCRDGSLQAEEGSAAWSPGGVPYVAGPFVGGMFAFPHPLCRWWLNLACLFQQTAFHQKQPGWEMNGFVWNWMTYFAQPTNWKKKKKKKKKPNKLSWGGLNYFFPSIFWFSHHTEKSIIS